MKKSNLEIDIFVENEEWNDAIPDAEELCHKACTDALIASGIIEHFNTLEVAITLAFDGFVQDLNKRFRNKDKPTNVLSFPNSAIRPGNYTNLSTNGTLMLGDIVVAYGVLLQEAKDQGKKPEDHLMHMIVHGTLHLLGFDHQNDSEARVMEGLEKSILRKHGVRNPYLLVD